MNTDSAFSSISMSKKRERFEKGKRLNAHTYKKLFQIAGQKMKDASQGGDLVTVSDASKEVDGIHVIKSCSDTKHEGHRVALHSEGVCFGKAESANKPPQMDAGKCVTVLKAGPTCSSELSEFQFDVSNEVRDHVLPYVNKLRNYWHRGQNSVFFDGQDRLIKVVCFVLSLLDSVKQPILIITASSSLSLWKTEFSKWSISTNVVTYKENKDFRAAIRSSEFYSENGSIKFQVLLSSPDAIVEDLEWLDHIKWELIVIDECQRPIISKDFRKIKMLVVDMKLLTITSEPVDVRQSYQNMLSLLDSKYEEIHMDADMGTNTLRERLLPFVAFECNFSASDIKEYWVPVHLSYTQIEQYCSLLSSNMEVLSSCFRSSSPLHDILTQTQKCCDHPYLVDPTLRDSLTTHDGDDTLDAEIRVSRKLQLLDKLLLEIKQCALRVVVLFKSVVSSEKITIGDILEDFVDGRFGEDSYVRIQTKIISKSQRKEMVNMFNNIDSGTFICLLDYRDCQSTIRLSSVDVAILFNSDWNPSNDLKDLHRLALDSKPLRVLRLYSSFTIEEKALILSKQGTSLDSDTDRINYNTCHRLLAWGASYLFNKLSKYPSSKSESDTCFIDDLVHELSSLLLNENVNTSTVSYAQLYDGVYSKNISLMGESETEAHTKESCSVEEYLMENGPNLFWSNLLKESHHIHTQGKSSSRLARRVKMSFRNPYYYWFGGYKGESEKDMEKFDRFAVTSSFKKKKSRSKRKVRARNIKDTFHTTVSKHVGGQQLSENANGEFQRESPPCILTESSHPFVMKHAAAQSPTVPSTCVSDPSASISSTNYVKQLPNNQPPQPQTFPVIPPVSGQSSIITPLEIELEFIKKEQDQVTKLHQEKKSMLLSECEKEISEIRTKYDALIEDSDMYLSTKMNVLRGYYDLVYANKLLADTLTQTCDNEEKTEKETGGVRILEIPASALVQSENRCTTSTSIPTLRAPAPHLRSSSSLFASFNKLPTMTLLGSHYGTC